MKSTGYLSSVNNHFTIAWSIATLIIPWLRDSEQITILELLSRQWKTRIINYWLKKQLPEVSQELVTNKLWSWQPPKLIPWKFIVKGNWQSLESIPMQLIVDSLDLVVKKINYFVEAYIGQHPELSDLQKKHLRSRNVARQMIDNQVTIAAAASRVASAVKEWKNYPMPGETLGLSLGIPPSIFREGGTICLFGPHHVTLVKKHDVPPAIIHKLPVPKIKQLPELQSLFPVP